jgi:hypothetical protein
MEKSVLIPGIFLVSILAISLVSSQALPAPAQLPSMTFNSITSVFNSLLSGISEDVTLVKVLLVMLLTIILFRPAYNLVGKKSGIAFMVALIVSILGIKYLATYDMVKGLLLPYGALAIAISSILPFLLIGGLLATSELSMPLRKLTWGMMAGSFILLWTLRWNSIGDLSYIYLGLGVISALILLFFDSTIRVLYAQAAGGNTKAVIDIQIAKLNKDISDLYVLIGNTPDTRLRARLENQVRDLEHTRRDIAKHRGAL